MSITFDALIRLGPVSPALRISIYKVRAKARRGAKRRGHRPLISTALSQIDLGVSTDLNGRDGILIGDEETSAPGGLVDGHDVAVGESETDALEAALDDAAHFLKKEGCLRHGLDRTDTGGEHYLRVAW